MKKTSFFLLAFVLSFSVLFTGFGYAKLTGMLQTSAGINVEDAHEIFITDVAWKSSHDTVWQVNGYAMRVMNTTVTRVPDLMI